MSYKIDFFPHGTKLLLMTTFWKTLKTLLLNRPLSRKLLRGDNLVGEELGRGKANALRSPSPSP